MTIQLSDTLRTNMINQYESTIGTAPKLYLRSGAQPANCAAADSGTLLATLSLPSDWVGAGSTGTVTIANGPWTGTGATAGTAAHYRIKETAGTATGCFEQGSIGQGSGDLSLDNNVIAVGQAINITTWTRTQGGV